MMVKWIFLVVSHFPIIASILQMVGAMLMANVFFNIKAKSMIQSLFSGVFRGEKAQRAAGAGRIYTEEPIKTLQGLSLIFLGFLLNLIHDISYHFGFLPIPTPSG